MNDKEIYEYLNSLGWEEHYVNDPYVKYYRFRVPSDSGWEYFYLERSSSDAALCLHPRYVNNSREFRSIYGVELGGKRGALLLKSADMLDFEKTIGRTGDEIPEFFPIRFFTKEGLIKAIELISQQAKLRPDGLSGDADKYLTKTAEPAAQVDVLEKNTDDELRRRMEAEAQNIDFVLGTISGEDVDVVAKRRVGQSVFRTLLERELGQECWLSGLKTSALLIASHIVPWSKSSGEQKIDPENGLLLSVTWDALFDKGFISFDDEGVLLLSKKLDEDIIRLLGISSDANLPPSVLTAVRKENLAWHRKRFEFPEL